VGPKSEERMLGLGLRTFADLQNADTTWLTQALGEEGLRYRELALGRDNREVHPSREAKSIGAEQTYMRDLENKTELARAALAHAEQVAKRLTDANLRARTITLKLKDSNFRLFTKRETFQAPVRDATTINECAQRLLDALDLHFPVKIRLVGLSASGLESEGETRSLFVDAKLEKRSRLESLVQEAQKKMNTRIVRADLLTPTGES
jgi:DNA polymerase IV